MIMADLEMRVCRVRCLHLNRKMNQDERSGWDKTTLECAPASQPPYSGCATRFYPLKYRSTCNLTASVVSATPPDASVTRHITANQYAAMGCELKSMVGTIAVPLMN